EAHHVHHDGAVAGGDGVVVVAVEEERVDERSDLSPRSLDEREAQIARRVLDAEEVARESSIRSRDVDRARVSELADPLVPRVPEPDGVGQAGDRPRLSGQEMPATRRAPPPVASDVRLLLRAGGGGSVPRVEADRHDLEVAADGQ